MRNGDPWQALIMMYVVLFILFAVLVFFNF